MIPNLPPITQDAVLANACHVEFGHRTSEGPPYILSTPLNHETHRKTGHADRDEA